MKKVLVTGTAGTIGLQTIKYLLSEGKYEITALDLKSKVNIKRLRGYKNRVNIVYGDICDKTLIESLVKDHQIIIHLAGISPVYVNYKPELGKAEYEYTVTLVNAIKKKNPKCFLLYSSSMDVYGNSDVKKLTVKTKTEASKFDHYAKYKIMCENYITSNLENYSIFRLAYLLASPHNKSTFYSVKYSTNLETIILQDAAYSFVSAIDHLKEINGKVYNVTSGKDFRMNYASYLYRVFCLYGLSMKYFKTWLFAEKNYYSNYCTDDDDLENVIHFRHKSLNDYYNSFDKYSNDIRRIVPKFLAIPFRWYAKKVQK